MEDSINELNKLVDKGKIRSLGVCNFGVDDLNEILNLGVFSTDQLPYNLLWRPIEEEILPECKKNNIGIICYSPLAQGLLTGRYRNADEVPDGISDQGFLIKIDLCLIMMMKVARMKFSNA